MKRKIVFKDNGKALQKRKKTNQKIMDSEEEDDNTENDEDNTLYVYCQENISMSSKNDGRVKLISCENWSYEGCTGWLSDDLYWFQCNSF